MAWYVTLDSRNRGDEDETLLSPEVIEIPEEQERFLALGKECSRKLFGDYKAAGKNPYDLSLMLDDPYHPYIMPSPYPSLMEGWKWPMPDQPFRDRLKWKEGRLVDIIGTTFGTMAISRKTINIIESIEPSVHQYLPYELVCKDGSIHPDQRWLLNVCARAETLDYERSNVIPIRDHPHWISDRTNRRHLVVRKEAVAGRAMWFEYRYRKMGSGMPFMLSDRFWDALNTAGCDGWRPQSGDYGQHIEEV